MLRMRHLRLAVDQPLAHHVLLLEDMARLLLHAEAQDVHRLAEGLEARDALHA